MRKTYKINPTNVFTRTGLLYRITFSTTLNLVHQMVHRFVVSEGKVLNRGFARHPCYMARNNRFFFLWKILFFLWLLLMQNIFIVWLPCKTSIIQSRVRRQSNCLGF